MAKFARTASYTSLANPSGKGQSALEEFKANIQPSQIKANTAQQIANMKIADIENKSRVYTTQLPETINTIAMHEYTDENNERRTLGQDMNPYIKKGYEGFKSGLKTGTESLSTVVGGGVGLVASPFVGAYQAGSAGVDYVRNFLKKKQEKQMIDAEEQSKIKSMDNEMPTITEEQMAGIKPLESPTQTVDESGLKQALTEIGDKRRNQEYYDQNVESVMATAGEKAREEKKIEISERKKAKDEEFEQYLDKFEESTKEKLIADPEYREYIEKGLNKKKRAKEISSSIFNPILTTPKFNPKALAPGVSSVARKGFGPSSVPTGKGFSPEEQDSFSAEQVSKGGNDTTTQKSLVYLMSRPSSSHGNISLSKEQSAELEKAVNSYTRNVMNSTVHSEKKKKQMIMNYIKNYYRQLTGTKWKVFNRKTIEEARII